MLLTKRLVFPDFPEFLSGQDSQKWAGRCPARKNLHSAGHYGPEDAGNLHPPYCASPAFETGTSRDMTCFSGTEKPVSLSKKNKKKSYDHE